MRRTVALALAAALAGLLLASCGPRMKRQVGLRPYKREMPPMPDNTVPRSGIAPIPTAEEAAGLRAPREPTPETLALGGRYYGYYCALCHGADGRGRCPVGDSYEPRPADLTSDRACRMSDGELYRGMLVGRGHEPVLSATVPSERRWPIVAYVRSLAQASGPPTADPRR